MFFLLAGTGAFLYPQPDQDPSEEVSRFLWTRGSLADHSPIWTIIEFAWTFVPWTFGGVIWSLGVSMVLILAGLVWLPEWAILTFGLGLVVTHDLFDVVQPTQMGSLAWLWALLHCRGVVPGTNFFVLFPLVPWVGVMASGYVLGRVMLKERSLRQRILLFLGSTLTPGVRSSARVEHVRKSDSRGSRQLPRRVAPTSCSSDDDHILSRRPKYPPSLRSSC